jgi:uncharacterized protein YndB with AHSA1/START domain
MRTGTREKVVVRRRIAATREELFDAWTDPESLRHWMLPGDVVSAEVEVDARLGGAVHFKLHGPKEVHEHTGEFTVFDRPAKLAFTWTAKNMAGQPTIVTVEFLKLGERETELLLTHEGFSTKGISERYQGGWGKIVANLAEHVQRRA